MKYGANCLCDLKGKRHQNAAVSDGPRVKKFNIVSNDHARTQKKKHFVFRPEIPFL